MPPPTGRRRRSRSPASRSTHTHLSSLHPHRPTLLQTDCLFLPNSAHAPFAASPTQAISPTLVIQFQSVSYRWKTTDCFARQSTRVPSICDRHSLSLRTKRGSSGSRRPPQPPPARLSSHSRTRRQYTHPSDKAKSSLAPSFTLSTRKHPDHRENHHQQQRHPRARVFKRHIDIAKRLGLRLVHPPPSMNHKSRSKNAEIAHRRHGVFVEGEWKASLKTPPLPGMRYGDLLPCRHIYFRVCK